MPNSNQNTSFQSSLLRLAKADNSIKLISHHCGKQAVQAETLQWLSTLFATIKDTQSQQRANILCDIGQFLAEDFGGHLEAQVRYLEHDLALLENQEAKR